MPRPTRPSHSPVAINTLIANSAHLAFEDQQSQRVRCSVCLASVPFSNKQNLLSFLAAPCIPRQGSSGFPLQLGNQFTHSSHRLRNFSGTLVCLRCGGVGKVKLHKLAAPCQPPTSAGKNILKNINRLTATGSDTDSTFQSRRHQDILQDIESKLKDLELEGCLEPPVSDFSFSESDRELGPSPIKGESGSSSGSD